ncbi:RidA family protein [Arthrobacter sp. ISL-65]|uniref:RidA family protein n=1 Tax=Arthrobacter sp. ISL-65 TaxID=2819112 RepID=UPI001BE54C3B|nr:RidA family protein [Arthrobacter sp. ISL-65]MBT2548923.1 RidA family protein [Arthrobacter sp. ISL-65]
MTAADLGLPVDAITFIPEPGADPEAALYSDTATAGGVVWTTQIPTRPDGSIPAGIEAQSRQVLDNLRAALERAGSRLDRVLHMTIYFTDLAQRSAFNELYREYFPAPRPVRCALGVSQLGIAGMKVELTATAAVSAPD